MAAKVSVVIPCYNHGRYLEQAVRSALEQEGVDAEVIVVDDGSTDETAAVAAQFGPSIRYQFQENAGVSAAFNTGLSMATGDYLYFLGADDVLLPGGLAALAGYLQAHPDEGAVYGDGYYCDDHLQILVPLSTTWRARPVGDVLPFLMTGTLMAPFLYRLSAIRQHGLAFDPALRIGEDWDFTTRFAAYERFGFVDVPCYSYRLHGDNSMARTGVARQENLIRNRRKTMESWFFDGLPDEVRARFLTDFLVHHLRGRPEEQAELLAGPEVAALSPAGRSGLYRSYGLSALDAGDNHTARERLRHSLAERSSPHVAAMVAASYLPSAVTQPLLHAARKATGRQSFHPMDLLLSSGEAPARS